MCGRILVTGASGFVGREVTVALRRAGYNVTAVVRRMPELAVPANEVVVRELGPTMDWSDLLCGVTHVIHLAAVAHKVGQDDKWKDEFFRVNRDGTKQLALQSRAANAMAFIYVSSIGVLGVTSSVPLVETDPMRPCTPYAASKSESESLVMNVLEGSPTRYTILRPPLVYGPGNPGNMARMLRLVKSGLPLPLASVQNCRSFLYVKNLVHAILLVLEATNDGNQIYHVADAETVSTPELIRVIAAAAGRPARLVPCPPAVLHVLGFALDCGGRIVGKSSAGGAYSVERLVGSLAVSTKHIEQRLGWTPPYSLQEGLAATLRNAVA